MRIVTLALLLGFLGSSPALRLNGEEKPRLTVKRLAPNLYVEDVGPCVKFWERLGFEKTMEVPDGARLAFAQMKKGGFEVMYGSYASLEREPAGMRGAARGGPSFLYVEVANLDAAIAAIQGAEVVAGVHTTFYGAKEVTVKDPGGNVITFAQFDVH
jgi:uncharacterized glyoxalase superfamily protein PhnB